MPPPRSSAPVLALLGWLALAAGSAAQEPRAWTSRGGQSFTAQILACDAYRATLEVTGRGKVILPLASLSAADREFVEAWRRDTPRAPLIDPAFLAKWPEQAAAEKVTVQVIEEKAVAKSFIWESAHFRIRSDLRLPLGIVRDLAGVFEATREVLLAVPFGLHVGLESAKYEVRLFAEAVDYGQAGGIAGSGGYFNGREMLILLPNLGIKPGTNGLSAEYAKNLFVLKHEVTHQILRTRDWLLPVWLDEGLAECVASWPYTQGRYTLQGLDAALHDYLLKWRRATDRSRLSIVAPSTLMGFTRRDWRDQVKAQSAYDHYNSAALLTHYFLRHDGAGDGAGLAAYFAALRAGVPPQEAEERHLRRGRTAADLSAAVQKLARRLALDITLE